MSFYLVIGKTKQKLQRHWISRWELLTDLTQELGTEELTWTYTKIGPIRLWVKLNERMDKFNKFQTVHPLSELYDVVRLMRPVDASYLQYVHIDEKLPQDLRGELYHDLGRYIRADVLALKRTYAFAQGLCRRDLGLHYNLGVSYDPIHSRTSARDAFPSKHLLLECQFLNRLTGLMSDAHRLSILSYRTPREQEDSFLSEVPWYYINWADAKRFAASDEEAIRSFSNAIARAEVNKADPSEIEQLIAEFDARDLTGQSDAVLFFNGESAPERPRRYNDAICVGSYVHSVTNGQARLQVPDPVGLLRLLSDRSDHFMLLGHVAKPEEEMERIEGTCYTMWILTHIVLERFVKSWPAPKPSWPTITHGAPCVPLSEVDLKEACQYFAETLGRRALLSVVRSINMEEIAEDDEDDSDVEEEDWRYIFVPTALDVVEDESYPLEFTSWPRTH